MPQYVLKNIDKGVMVMFAGYKFKDTSLYDLARTHTSYSNEKKLGKLANNQRLEFLGDSILGLIAGDYIYKNFPDLPEGSLTKIRADVVCEKSLYELAMSLNLGECLLLGKGEELCGGRTRISNLADAFEAMLGAVYLDSDLETVRGILIPLLEERIKRASKCEAKYDYKTRLQEYVQSKGSKIIKYTIIKESGPDHMRTYTSELTVDGKCLGTGEGRSKKESEQSAAKNAMERLMGNETL